MQVMLLGHIGHHTLYKCTIYPFEKGTLCLLRFHKFNMTKVVRLMFELPFTLSPVA